MIRDNHLAIYLTDSDKERLQELADKDYRSLSMEGLLLLREAMDERNGDKK